MYSPFNLELTVSSHQWPIIVANSMICPNSYFNRSADKNLVGNYPKTEMVILSLVHADSAARRGISGATSNRIVLQRRFSLVSLQMYRRWRCVMTVLLFNVSYVQHHEGASECWLCGNRNSNRQGCLTVRETVLCPCSIASSCTFVLETLLHQEHRLKTTTKPYR